MNAEAAVISAVCKNKDISAVLEGDVEEFFVSHKDVWAGLKSYYYKYKEIPDIAVLETDYRDFDEVAVTAPTEFYVDKLRTNYLNSRTQNALVKSLQDLKAGTPAIEVIQSTQAAISELNKFSGAVKDIDATDIGLAVRDLERRAERADAMGGAPGILTGFQSIDTAYRTGFAGGHLGVFIGWPGRAKSWFSEIIAIRAWEQGFNPMIVSLEMSAEGMRDRIHTLMGQGAFRMSDFSAGAVNLDDFKSWGRKNVENKAAFTIVSSEGMDGVTPSKIQSKIDQYKPKMVIVDYHQLLDDDRKSKNEVERNKNISRDLKQMAVRNNIPVLDITAATSDDIAQREDPPMLSQVAWSKAIEYDADIAFAVHKYTDSDLVEIVSRKNRHGSNDINFFLDFDIDRGVFKETFERSD